MARIEVRDPNVLKLLDEHGDVRDIEELEADIIRFAKSHYRGHLTEVARRLKIGRSTLYRKLKQYGLAMAPADGCVGRGLKPTHDRANLT